MWSFSAGCDACDYTDDWGGRPHAVPEAAVRRLDLPDTLSLRHPARSDHRRPTWPQHPGDGLGPGRLGGDGRRDVQPCWRSTPERRRHRRRGRSLDRTGDWLLGDVVLPTPTEHRQQGWYWQTRSHVVGGTGLCQLERWQIQRRLYFARSD